MTTSESGTTEREMTDVIVDVLTEARRLIATPDQWTKFTLARGRTNRPTKLHSPRAAKFCIEGACERAAVTTGYFGYLYVVDKLRQTQGLPRDPSLAEWQDAPERTHDEVLKLIDRTLASRLARR